MFQIYDDTNGYLATVTTEAEAIQWMDANTDVFADNGRTYMLIDLTTRKVRWFEIIIRTIVNEIYP